LVRDYNNSGDNNHRHHQRGSDSDNDSDEDVQDSDTGDDDESYANRLRKTHSKRSITDLTNEITKHSSAQSVQMSSAVEPTIWRPIACLSGDDDDKKNDVRPAAELSTRNAMLRIDRRKSSEEHGLVETVSRDEGSHDQVSRDESGGRSRLITDSIHLNVNTKNTSAASDQLLFRPLVNQPYSYKRADLNIMESSVRMQDSFFPYLAMPLALGNDSDTLLQFSGLPSYPSLSLWPHLPYQALNISSIFPQSDHFVGSRFSPYFWAGSSNRDRQKS